ncbi:MAG: rhodanese-like domain-containing protein [Phaeodactylibacter sp.]|nr:rhodanese-like domain-containing protein [Phaeodactylibacter sp.]MCB9303682.1 rhodanese-like domain-containing protein [Lewinellaceae bacterium]
MDLVNVFSQKEVSLIDVREPFEFAMGHAPGAVNIPLGTVPSRVEEFRKMPQPVILYCRSGNRSGQAMMYLKACGVSEAYNAGTVEEVMYYQHLAAQQGKPQGAR